MSVRVEMPSPWVLVNKAALILTHPAVTASYLMYSRQPVRLTGQGLNLGPPSFVGCRVASGRARFLLHGNSVELLVKQAIKAMERPCVQSRAMLEIMISRPGSLTHWTSVVSLPALQRNSVETKPESPGLPFSVSPFISLWGRDSMWV